MLFCVPNRIFEGEPVMKDKHLIELIDVSKA